MFMLLWGPTIAAVSVILDYAEDTLVVRQALDSILLRARIASYHCLHEVRLLEGDQLVCKMLNPLACNKHSCRSLAGSLRFSNGGLR